MNRYQRSLMNKIDDLEARLREDWAARRAGHPNMSWNSRHSLETEVLGLRLKLEATYKKA